MMLQELDQYCIRNIGLWTHSKIVDHCDVWIENGKLKKLSFNEQKSAPPSLENTEIDGTNKVLLPAGVDPQVHLRVPGQPEKETPLSGLSSALKGGIAAVLTMPNTNPVLDCPEALDLANKQLRSAMMRTGVSVGLSAAITKGQKGLELCDLESLAQKNIWAFTDDGYGVPDDEQMEEAFRVSAKTGIPILQHAEVKGHGGVLAPGPLQSQLGLKPYPASAEYEMVARDLEILQKHPQARYHVLHISCKETIDLVVLAKRAGLKVSCEVSPHHLFFSTEDIKAEETAFKMNPPLRSGRDRRALQKALAEGVIDFVATDHAPHENKLKGHKFATAAYGTTGLETSLLVLLTLLKRGLINEQRLVQVFAKHPAVFLDLKEEDGFGGFYLNKPFRATLIDLHKTTTISKDYLLSQSKNSCFLGQELNGKIEYTFIKDKIWNLQLSEDS